METSEELSKRYFRDKFQSNLRGMETLLRTQYQILSITCFNRTLEGWKQVSIEDEEVIRHSFNRTLEGWKPTE